MPASQAELESITRDLTENTFEAFAEDISTMFDTPVTCQQMDYGEGTFDTLKETYKKLAAVITVKSEGALNGNFHVIFNKEGLFTLAGTFVMQPVKVIEQNRRGGSEQEAKEVSDALGEVGNLMVGSWDRVFREELPEHGHFVQSGTFSGNPFAKAESEIGIGKSEECLLVQYEMTVDPLEPFDCTAIYPKSLFAGSAAAAAAKGGADEEEEAEAAEDATQTVEQTEEAVAEAETPEQPKAEEAEDDTTEPESEESSPDEQTDQQVEQAVEQAEQATDQAAPAPEEVTPQTDPHPVSDAIRNITQGTGFGPPAAGILANVSAKDIMRPEVVWAEPEDTVEQLVAKMQQGGTGYLLVGKEGKLEGLISKSDVRGAMSPYLQSMFSKWRGPMDVATLQIKAKWVMSRPVRTVRPDTNLSGIMSAMSQHGGRCMPVVGTDGKVAGIVTVFDIFRALNTQVTGATHAGQTGEKPVLA